MRPPYRPRKVPLDQIAHYDVSYKKYNAPEGKSHFVKLGVAFPNESGRIVVKLDAMPINTWDGELWLFPKGGGGEDAAD